MLNSGVIDLQKKYTPDRILILVVTEPDGMEYRSQTMLKDDKKVYKKRDGPSCKFRQYILSLQTEILWMVVYI